MAVTSPPMPPPVTTTSAMPPPLVGPVAQSAPRRAFVDDPVMAHLIPPEARQHTERLARFMLLGTKGAVAEGTVYTTPELSGGAVWRAPDRWKVPTRQLLPDLPALVWALG